MDSVQALCSIHIIKSIKLITEEYDGWRFSGVSELFTEPFYTLRLPLRQLAPGASAVGATRAGGEKGVGPPAEPGAVPNDPARGREGA